jgi:hypothetical protein
VAPPEIDDLVARLRAQLDAAQRDPDGFEVKLTPLVLATADAMGAVGEQGVTDVITVPWLYHGPGPYTLAEKVDHVHRFADEVIAPLSS